MLGRYREPEVRLAAVDAADILLPAPVIAELYFGARASLRVRENVARVDRLLTFFRLHPFDEAAARRFAEIKADLRKTGRVLMIAAIRGDSVKFTGEIRARCR
ncbi:type II toxin-antitoxin system VapC family toxin [Sorangium sp. So ce204]|uniref:type II toxin-antitoxin system VapC family toxin n=1 Tax=Sorangium sp. So ce204 TaxID=3133288 RepID=UPI003F643F5F